MATFIDADGKRRTVSTSTPLPGAGGGSGGSSGASSTIIQPDGTGVNQIGTTLSKFVDGFNNNGDTPDTTKWAVLRQNLITSSIANGSLSLTVPATAGAEYLMVGKVNTTIPANLMAIVMASARNANTAVRIGYVAVDPTTGIPVPHATLTGDFADRANFSYANGNVNSGIMETISSNSTVKAQAVTGSYGTGGAGHELALELRAEDFTGAVALADTIGARSGGWRISTQVPGPNKVYRPFIWIVNTAAAVASVWNFQRILSMDIQELQAEIGGGRGNSSASQSIPVNITGSASYTQPISGLVTINRLSWFTETATLLAAAATLTGATRDNGATPLGPFKTFTAEVYSDQAGTLFVERSTNGTTWFPSGQIAVPAAVNTALSVTMTARYYRMRFTNTGGATQTSFLPTTSFSA